MATEIIYRTDEPEWQVERQPAGVTDPMVVRFRKVGKNRTLLDQNARWTPLGWDCKRWVPSSPKVPQWLLEKVVLHMQTLDLKP
jgi:hypothetical protein